VENALNQRGSSPRYYKNTLLFLSADKAKIDILAGNTAQYLAWKEIVDNEDAFNLDTFQRKQANTKLNQFNDAVEATLKETYQWLLIPHQPNAQGSIEWKETRLNNQDSPILQASRKAVYENDLLPNYAGSNLRRDALDNYLWKDCNHIDLKRFWDYLAQYLYLPRLKDQNVLLTSVKEAVGLTTWAESFAYAEGFDEETGKYIGLRVAEVITPSISPHSLIVKPDVAQKQLDDEAVPSPNKKTDKWTNDDSKPIDNPDVILPKVPVLRRFYGSVDIDAIRINRDTPEIAKEVIQHLTALHGARVKITLEIEAEIPEGVPNDVVRTVTENCRTLKFKTQSFEQS
jgi:hypothetical protein